ncbi:hypothetical protein MKZ38_000569 [Zalerion maritima]|uniref:Uncharacterized protein n=1 Tax=Zalerion maritima TaxID=339359 RepID=A0AAD5RSF1_9PEZI|nr:hypothetical protein MKZ38_000569 [Zalerion maritima]
MAHILAALQGEHPLSEKRKAVQGILDKLENDLDTQSLSDHERDCMLEKLKVYGRDPRGSDPIFSEKGIETLAKHGFQTPSKPYSRQALRCLANAMFLKDDSRGRLVELGFAPKACLQIAEDCVEDEFLGSRILFLTTYAKNDHLVDLIDNHHLAESVAKNLQRHAERPPPSGSPDPIADMALTDTLNLFYNVTSFLEKEHPDKLAGFEHSISHIVSLLNSRPIPSPKPLDQPMDKLVNALMNLDLSKQIETFFPSSSPTTLPTRFTTLVDKALSAYSESELETSLTPLVTVLLKLLPSAPEEALLHFQSKFLPQSSERTHVLGQGDSVPEKLLKNTTNPMAPNLRELLGHLLFGLSDKDATKFVDNVGYGFASGYLFQNQIPVPDSVREAHGDTATGRPVNPITGQFTDQEREPNVPEMTDDEKEREAERLFVLFERLRQTGVVDVENPVRQAYQTGRIQELDSDDEEDKD